MTSKKTSTAKKTTTAKAPSHKAKAVKAKPKASWAETMKKALEKRQPAGGFPDQGKPRGSGVQPVRKNAF
jgi:hypothetical protein